MKKWHALFAGAGVLAGTACSDLATSPGSRDLVAAALSASLSSAPAGFGDLATSYVGAPSSSFDREAAALWMGGGRDARMAPGGMMGGGIGDAFVGGISFGGRGGHHGPFGGGLGCQGTFDAATGRVTCPVETRQGLSITRSARYTNAAGAVQQTFDSLTTNSVNLQSSVTGTVTFTRGAADSARRPGGPGGHGGRGGHGGPGGPGHGHRLLGDTATILASSTTVNNASDRTTSGLASGSTQRTVNGTSRGQESTTGTSSRGQFTASRSTADTTRGLVVPVRTGASATPPYPTAGTVIRVMSASLGYAGKAPVTVSRREVVTYDGSATAKVTLTENGTTRNCTRPLPRGPLACQ